MKLIRYGAMLAALGVILGAFGAHGLQGKITLDLLEVYKTSTHYLLIHALGLILFGLMNPKKTWPAACFLGGILLFSGSLYGIVFTGIRKLGMITPLGGLLFIAGWIGIAVLAKSRAPESKGA